MENIQELINIIESYKICKDYNFHGHTLGNAYSQEIFEKKDVYTIISPELKNKLRPLIFEINGTDFDGRNFNFTQFSQRGERKPDGKYWEYRKGRENNDPDIFEIGKISDKEMQGIRTERGKSIDKIFKNSERFYNKDKDKCAFCNKKVDFTKGGFIARGSGDSWTFCSRECLSHANEVKKNQTKNNQGFELTIDGNPKCLVCGINYDERKNSSWTQFTLNEEPTENYCGGCSKNREKKLEINSEQTRLTELRNQIQNPANSAKRSELENEIKERENRLSKLKQESKKTQLQLEINKLENKSNRTPEEERSLKDKKEELKRLNKQVNSEQDKGKNQWIKPALLISGSVLVISLIIYLIAKNKKNKH